MTLEYKERQFYLEQLVQLPLTYTSSAIAKACSYTSFNKHFEKQKNSIIINF